MYRWILSIDEKLDARVDDRVNESVHDKCETLSTV